jgi:hypothetical protein
VDGRGEAFILPMRSAWSRRVMRARLGAGSLPVPLEDFPDFVRRAGLEDFGAAARGVAQPPLCTTPKCFEVTSVGV